MIFIVIQTQWEIDFVMKPLIATTSLQILHMPRQLYIVLSIHHIDE